MNKSIKSGMTIFVAVLVVSMLSLAVFSVTNITLKQVLISGSLKSSQQAYFAADSGMQCAVAYDTHEYVSNGVQYFNIGGLPAANMECSDGLVTWKSVTGSGDIISECYSDGTAESISKDFSFNIENDGKVVCSKVQVIKKCENGIVKTVINSRGYSSACENGNVVTNNRTVERYVWMNY